MMPNNPLHQTAAAISVFRSSTAHSAAAAAELGRSCWDPQSRQRSHCAGGYTMMSNDGTLNGVRPGWAWPVGHTETRNNTAIWEGKTPLIPLHYSMPMT